MRTTSLLLLRVSTLLRYPDVVPILISTLSSGDKNKHRYVIATQSQPLRNHLRAIPAVPIVHIKKSVMILEPPSKTTLNVKAEVRISLHNLLCRRLMTAGFPTVRPSACRPKSPRCTPPSPNGEHCPSPHPNLTHQYGGRRSPKGQTP